MKMINILYPHTTIYGGLDSFYKTAKSLGYPYFCWNGWIFCTKSGERQPFIIENGELISAEIPLDWGKY